MRPRPLVLSLTAALLALPSTALASPEIKKGTIGPVPTESNLDRDQALQRLREGEQLLLQDQPADGLLAMLEAYVALEQTDGAEARGVKELRSWLVKALEAADLPDEAATMRARGSYVDHPLTVLPSTWFPQSSSATPAGVDEATKMVEDGLNMLSNGNIEGLGQLLAAYEIVERELGPESEDAKVVRSFLVGLLETGGFQDEANILRARGSVTPATQEDTEVYAATWILILEAEEAGQSPVSSLSGGLADKGQFSSSGSDASSTSSDDSSSDDSTYDDGDDKPGNVEKGSAIPSVLVDVGIGTFQPEYGRKGLIWSAGLELHWTLFTARWFGMQLGGGGQFGRNRDKRWQADAHGELRLAFDFSKVYIRPEFGAGYDQVAGGKLTIAEAYHVAPAAYYHFGGTLGVRFADRFGIYGRAVRLRRGDVPVPNETRVRGGFTIGFDEVSLDLAFVFTDYDARGTLPGARIFSGNLGFRI